MIKSLLSLFELPDAKGEDDTRHQLRLVAAALLIETARADFTQDADEEAALAELLRTELKLTQGEVEELLALANHRVDESTSLYEFTRVINDHYSAEDKLELISCMWRVAYADGQLDKYEEHLIRQVAELTYVPHSDYIRCKLAVEKAH